MQRCFQQWCEREVLRNILVDLANALREEGEIGERESFIDATFSPARGGGEEIGRGKRGKWVKILAIVDWGGLPLSVSTHAANHHEVRCAQLCFDFYMLEAKPEKLIGDKAFDSEGLDAELAKEGGGDDRAPSLPSSNPEDPRRQVPSPLRAALDRGEIFRLVALEAPSSDPLGVLRRELPRLRATWMHHDAAQTILR